MPRLAMSRVDAIGLLLAICTLPLAGCNKDDAATTLTLSGTPSPQIAIDERYSFAPTATGTNGAALTFAVTGRPAWLTFDPTTGALTGRPTMSDVGIHRGISIEASDGQTTARLSSFDIEVVALGTHAVTISWSSPTANEDGSPLTDLAGFEIRYGRQSGSYSHRIAVANPGVASYVVGGLAAGNYYFTLTARNDEAIDSEPATEMSIVVQ